MLNAGVIGFGADASKRGAFLQHWLKVAESTREMIAEQTALPRIIETRNREILRPDESGAIEWDGDELSVQVLDGDEYNFTHIEELAKSEAEIPDTIRVLHFKHGQFRREHFQKIVEQADLGATNRLPA